MPYQQRILCVDDESTVRLYLTKILKISGFDVLEATDGMEAIAILQEVRGAINLVVTDIRMPRMDGVALAEAMAVQYSDIPVLFISGYAFDFAIEQKKYPAKMCAFVQKPFLAKALLEAVHKCLESPEVAPQQCVGS